jgi:hypothetical protein
MKTNQTEKLLESMWSNADRGILAIYSLPSAKAEFFNLAESGAIYKAIKTIAGKNGNQNIYHTLGLLNKRPEKRGKEDDVMGIAALWMDIDFAGNAHKKGKLPSSLEECLDFLETFPLKPTVIINSGNGLHVYWVFNEIWYFDGVDERKKARRLSDKFQNTLIQMAKEKGWDLDKTSDLVRLLRVPGTYNYKNPNDPKLVKIIKINENKYNPDEFEPFLIEHPDESRITTFDASIVYKGLSHGERNINLFRYARSRLAKGYDPKEVKLLVNEFSSLAKPEISKEETKVIFESALSYQKEKPLFEGRRFVPDHLVNNILESYDLFHDGKSFFKYNGRGLWQEIHDNEIGKEMKSFIGKRARRSYIQDSMKLLEFEVFKNASELEQRFELINLSNGMLDVQEKNIIPAPKSLLNTGRVLMLRCLNNFCMKFLKMILQRLRLFKSSLDISFCPEFLSTPAYLCWEAAATVKAF